MDEHNLANPSQKPCWMPMSFVKLPAHGAGLPGKEEFFGGAGGLGSRSIRLTIRPRSEL
jgi:hypothetical protein